MASTSVLSQNLSARCHTATRLRKEKLAVVKPKPTSAKDGVRCDAEQSKRVQMGPIARRESLLAMAAAPALMMAAEAPPALAVQGMTAGRIPGIGPSDIEGFSRYRRPDGKAGGHGVGWSEIPPYSFEVPLGWEEIPVSIADLGGSEVDLRFQLRAEGDMAVVVAPVLRFYDVGYNASVTIEELGKPEKIIRAFAPELIGNVLEEEDIMRMETVKYPDNPLTYYIYDLKPHYLISATAYRNRLFVQTIRASSVQWRKAGAKLQVSRDSFRVSTA